MTQRSVTRRPVTRLGPVERARRRRQRRSAVAAFPDAVELLIVGVRSGLAPPAAFEVATEQSHPTLRPAFEEVVHQMRRGRRFADALAGIPEWLGPHAAYFVDALVAADRYGLPLEPVLDRLTVDVRADRSRQAQVEARTLPVRLAFPLVVCTLPSFVLLAIAPAVLGAISTLRG